MEINKTSKESAPAGKAGEPTAETKITLSAAGMTDLLKSEFNAEAAIPEREEAETPPAQEIPAAGESDVAEVEKEVEQPGEAKPEGEPETPADEGEHEEETPAGETPLPEALQSELDQWEATGGALPEALQGVVGKRIGKLTAARETEKARADQAEESLRAITAERDALRNDPQRPAHATPPTVLDEKAVATMAATAQKMIGEIESYLDDSATDEERGRVERFMASKGLDTKGLKRELRQTSAFLNQELPQLRQQVQAFKAQEASLSPVAKAWFPGLDDKTKPEYAEAQKVLSLMPELVQRTPAHKVAVGTYVLGLRVLDALNAAGHDGDAIAALQPLLAKAFPPKGKAAAKAPAKTPPPKAPAGGSAVNRQAPARKDDVARSQFNKTPNRQTATELAHAALMAA